ncbi:MAG: DMT family transporter [Rhodocyclaceae bacterium]|nr:DMT family transporter [Rhodocyclaceae bacterium]
MLTGILAALGAGMLWGLIFLVPLVLGDYPPVVLSFGRYVAFGLLAVVLAGFDRRALARLSRSDWVEAAKLALVGNLLYYSTLAAAIQLAGAPVPAMIIGTLPVVIAITANLLESRNEGGDAVHWRRLAAPLAIILTGLGVVQFGPGEASAGTEADPFDTALGLLLACCALACWTWYPIRNSRWLRARPPGMSRAWATAQGLATLPLALVTALGFAVWDWASSGTGAVFSWPLGPRPALFVGLMLLTGLAASWLGTLLWNKASHLLPAALAGQLIVFETLAALLYAFLWYGRWPTLHETIGIALLVTGVLFGVRAFRRLSAD